MKKVPEIISFTENWQLIPYNKIPAFTMQIGKITCGDTYWSVDISASGQLIIYTDIPHPDDARAKCIYSCNPWPACKFVADKLLNEKETNIS